MDELSLGSKLNRHLTQVETKTGRRFCTACQLTRSTEGGRQRKHRWICASCIDQQRLKTRASIYSKS